VLTMSFIRDFFGGFAERIVNGAANRALNGRGGDRGRIERLCHELGWSVDERDGNAIRLHFNGPDGERRKVRISSGDKSIVGFYAHSDAVLPVHSVPPDLLAYLLRRNLDDSGIGMWGIIVHDDDDVTFHLCYMALGDGLDAEALKYICESLIGEAADFDAKLRQAGLLD
jgi:hypothetical protein